MVIATTAKDNILSNQNFNTVANVEFKDIDMSAEKNVGVVNNFTANDEPIKQWNINGS